MKKNGLFLVDEAAKEGHYKKMDTLPDPPEGREKMKNEE